MAFNIHASHRMLLILPAGLYLVLVLLCAVYPAALAERETADIPEPYVDPLVTRGRNLFTKRFNCVACHTQQIRGDESLAYEEDGRRVVPILAADARWGKRVTDAKDYAHESPALFGTQRTGPDLTNVGSRLPGQQWHFWHLYNPQAVSPGSNMQPYAFLFTTEPPPAGEEGAYATVDLVDGLGVEGDRLWATPDAVALVEYLLSLRMESR